MLAISARDVPKGLIPLQLKRDKVFIKTGMAITSGIETRDGLHPGSLDPDLNPYPQEVWEQRVWAPSSLT